MDDRPGPLGIPGGATAGLPLRSVGLGPRPVGLALLPAADPLGGQCFCRASSRPTSWTSTRFESSWSISPPGPWAVILAETVLVSAPLVSS